jgi:hypothetical protein
MEQYEYKVLAKVDFMESETTDCYEDPEDKTSKFIGATTSSWFNMDRFNKELSHFGSEGFRVITKLYNEPNDWVLVLSRPLAYLPKNRRA